MSRVWQCGVTMSGNVTKRGLVLPWSRAPLWLRVALAYATVLFAVYLPVTALGRTLSPEPYLPWGVTERGPWRGAGRRPIDTFNIDLGTPAYYHAIVWDTDFQPIDLNAYLPAGYVGSQAFAVDAHGNVAGSMVAADGTRHAVLWTLNQGR